MHNILTSSAEWTMPMVHFSPTQILTSSAEWTMPMVHFSPTQILTSSAEWTLPMVHFSPTQILPGGEKTGGHGPFSRGGMVHLFSLGTSHGRNRRKVEYISCPIMPARFP